MSRLELCLVIAATPSGRIGYRGARPLPWHLPGDLKRFKDLTTDQVVIMGSSTYHSLPGILLNRTNIVVTRSNLSAPVQIARSPLEALELANRTPAKRHCVIGGAALASEMFPMLNTVYLTRVKQDNPEWDAVIPELEELNDPELWYLSRVEDHPTHQYRTYRRVRSEA